MARNGTGSFFLPSGINPVADGTVISATWANQTLTDVAAGLTGSLPRDGQAPMTGTLKLADGSVTSPGIAWNSDGATGLFRPATSTLGFTAGGVEQARFTAGNLLMGSTLDTGEKLQVTGAVKFVGALNLTGALTGSSTAIFTGNVTAPTFIGALSGTASAATYATVADTRATAVGPQTGYPQARFDFKANTTDGLSDGGTYHSVLTIQQYTDPSGGGTRQLGFTDGDNMWLRGSGSGLSAYGAWKLMLNSANYNNYSPTLTGGNASGTWAINVTGNAGSASSTPYTGITSVPTRANWASSNSNDVVAGQLTWRNFGSGHTVFDASKSLNPIGGAVNNTNPVNPWTPTFPTLMGFNGTDTYGVRVDSSRVSDLSLKLYSTDAAYTYGSASPYFMSMSYNGRWRLSVTPNSPGTVSVAHADLADNATNAATAAIATKANTINATGNAMTFNWTGQSGQPTWLWGANGATDAYVYNPSNFSVAYAANAANATRSASTAVLDNHVDMDRTGADVNSMLTNGTYGFLGTPPNSVGAGYGAMMVARNSDTGLQIAGGYTNDNLYFRGWGSSGGVFTPWRTLIHSANIGNQSVNYATSAGSANSATTAGSANSVAWTNVSGRPTAVSQLSNDMGYATTANSDALYMRRTTNVWNTSAEGTLRNYYAADGTTNYGTGSNYCWYNRNGAGTIMTLSAGGDLYCNGNIAAYSDARLKTKIEVIDNALEKLKQIRGVTYTRTDEGQYGVRQAGVIAQEVQKVLPEVVTETENGTLAVAYGNLLSLAIEAIKELEIKVTRLELAA